MITAYFGGLRHTETDGLKIENFVTTKEGVIVTHARSKINKLGARTLGARSCHLKFTPKERS